MNGTHSTARPGAQGLGPVTGCDLAGLDSLARPLSRDPFGRLRPPFSQEAARLSLELASTAYTLDLEPWAQAGWYDFSIQIDNALQSGLLSGESADFERMRALADALRLKRMKLSLRERNPVGQVLGALRQRERSDTVKAVCMMHALPGGRYLLAIGFMGTGRRLSDWISNFRFTTQEGFHKGFGQLCTAFEESAESLVFPATAAALGLEKLTLGEALMEMRSLSSRFRLWMAGHSQGGAVMQLLCHRLLTDWGVLAQNIVGYGFASPTVATGRLLHDPAAYPLYHILNSDDLVPRVGALAHLGLCLECPANRRMRQACYRLSTLPADVRVRREMAPYRRAMTGTLSVLTYSAAFLQCLAEEKGEEGLSHLMSRKWAVPAVDRLLTAAGERAMDWLNRFVQNGKNAYLELAGQPMDEARLSALREEMRPLVARTPMRRLMGGIVSYTLPPHRLTGDETHPGAYAYIVRNGLGALRPFIWLNPQPSPPRRLYARSARRPTAARPRRGTRRIGLSARRER